VIVCLRRTFTVAYKLVIPEPWCTMTLTEADRAGLVAAIQNVSDAASHRLARRRAAPLTSALSLRAV
jgi:hypothetical protein